jgi:hypothetical protein
MHHRASVRLAASRLSRYICASIYNIEYLLTRALERLYRPEQRVSLACHVGHCSVIYGMLRRVADADLIADVRGSQARGKRKVSGTQACI